MTGQCGQALPVLENYRFPLNLKSNRNLQDKKHTLDSINHFFLSANFYRRVCKFPMQTEVACWFSTG